MKRALRCAQPGCGATPSSPADGHLFYLGDVPAAWVCLEHADRASKFVDVTTEALAEGARLTGQRFVTGAANKLASLLFGE